MSNNKVFAALECFLFVFSYWLRWLHSRFGSAVAGWEPRPPPPPTHLDPVWGSCNKGGEGLGGGGGSAWCTMTLLLLSLFLHSATLAAAESASARPLAATQPSAFSLSFPPFFFLLQDHSSLVGSSSKPSPPPPSLYQPVKFILRNLTPGFFYWFISLC